MLSDGPMKLPDEIIRLLHLGIDQQYGALIIIQKRFVREFRKLLHKQLVQMLRSFGFPFIMQQDEVFSQFNVSRLIDFQLAQNEKVAKDQNRQEPQNVAMPPE